MSGYLSVTKWNEYQHYRDRTPTWVKFHVDMLHNEKLKALPLSTRLLWDQMLLLAATFQNSVPNSPELIGNLAGIPPELCREGVEQLLKGRWLREKQTRRAASKTASVEVRSKNKKEKAALATATTEAAERYCQAEAYRLTNDQLAKKLRSEYGITDEVTLRRLLAAATEARAA